MNSKKPHFLNFPLGNKKAQIGTLDLFAAISIASLILVGILSAYAHYNNVLERKILYNDLQITSFAALDYLIKNPGIPHDWENDVADVKNMGLASRPFVLSKEKTNVFNDLDYNTQKELLNVRGSDFYFAVKTLNNTVLKESGSYPVEKSYVVNAQRRIIYNNNTAIVELIMWRKK